MPGDAREFSVSSRLWQAQQISAIRDLQPRRALTNKSDVANIKIMTQRPMLGCGAALLIISRGKAGGCIEPSTQRSIFEISSVLLDVPSNC